MRIVKKNNWGLANMGRGAERVGFEEGVSHFPTGVEPGKGDSPLHRKFFKILAQNSAFWHLF